MQPSFRVFLLAVPMVLAPQLAAQDSVRLHSGATESGVIQAENYDGLLIKAGKGPQEKVARHAWRDVAQVTYAGAAEYQQAVAQLAAGNLGTAIPKLQSLAASASLRKELKPLVQFQLAAALQRSGKFAEAATAWLELVTAWPKTRYLTAAAQAVVECHFALGDPAAGSTMLESLVDLAGKSGVDSSYLMAFDYYRGRLLEAQNNLVGARSKYQATAALRDAPPSLVALGRLGIARCEQAEGQADRARASYRAIVDQQADNEVLAGAWNGLADLGLAEATPARSLEKATDALFMYLRGVVEFGPAPGESSGEYERALAGAARSFQTMSEFETDDAKKKQYAQRARQRLEQLRQEYPNSIHLQK